MKVTAILISLSLVFFVGVNGELFDTLYNSLINYKIPPTIPMIDKNTPVTVKIDMSLLKVLKLNTDEMSINTLTWVGYMWRDARFSWDPAIYGITKIRLSENLMWKPDVILFDGDTIKSNQVYKAIVSHEGDIILYNPLQFKSHCTVAADDNAIFECEMKFSSWVYDGTQLDLQTQSELDSVDLSNYKENPSWTLLNATQLRTVTFYSCCPEPYIDIKYTLRLRKVSPSVTT